MDDAFAHLVYDGGVVGCHDYGDAGVVDAFEEFHDFVAGVWVEVSGGFVGEEYLGSVDEGAGDGDALLFSSGKFVGHAVGFVLESNEFEYFGDEFLCDAAWFADDVEGEGDVAGYGFIVEELVVLEDHADVAAKFGDFPVGDSGEVVSGDGEVSGGGFFFPDDEFE